MEFKPIITAHSGCEGTPDNSLEYVKYALTTGADCLEVDIRKNPEGVLFLSHDSTNNSAGCPTLEEVFTIVASQSTMRINCDLKEAGLEREVYDLGKKCGMGDRLIFSGTVNKDTYAADDELNSHVEVYLNIEEIIDNVYFNYLDIPDFDLKAAYDCMLICKGCKITTINANEGLVTKRFVDTLASFDIGVSVWTVNGKERQKWCLMRGVKNMTTRRPLQALEIRKSL